MKRFEVSTLVMLMLLALVATGCENPATGKTEAVVKEAAGESEMPMAEGRRFVITDASKISFVGSKVTGSHDGGFNSFSGEIRLVDRDPAKSAVSVTIDTTSLWADNERLTGHLKSADFFDVAKYPSASFESTSIKKEGDGYVVSGDLQLHGVTKNLTFPASIQVEGDRVTAKAEFVIKRYDFKIEYPGKPDDLIRDEVVIRFDLTAVPADAA